MGVRQDDGILVRNFAASGSERLRILVLKLDHFGDFIIARPAFERLRRSFADSHLTLICGSWNCGLAEASFLFDAVRAFDHFPRNARNWDGVPVQTVETFDEVAAGHYDLAIDMRVDTDTRSLLRRVHARWHAGIGDSALFPWLAMALPLASTLMPQEAQPARPLMVLPPDAFDSRMPIRKQDEQVNNFSITNTCLLNSKPVVLPPTRCRAQFAVGLRGLGFARMRASMSFEVIQNGQIIVQRVFQGGDMGVLSSGKVVIDFESNVEGSAFVFRVHAARRPLFGKFVFRGLTIFAIEALMRPRWCPSDLHVGEKLSLLVALVEERLRLLYPQSPKVPALPADLAVATGAIVVAPLSNSSVRDWPMAHYAAMIEQLLQQPQLRVVLVGSAEQEPALAALQARCAASGRVISLAGRTDWSTLAAVLRRARLVICNNSGIAHLAASLGVPTLAIYSASHQMREWGPRGLLSRAIMADMPCSPCGLEAVAACPYGHSCMTRITPEMVAAQALDMLAFDAAEMAVPPVPAWQNG